MQNLFNPSKASFDEPISMLMVCHERVRHFVGRIEKLTEYLFQHGVDQQVKEAIAAVIRYFDIAAPLHHADEDEDLFAVLHDTLQNAPLNQTIARLTAEHQVLEARWQEMKQQLTEVVEGKRVLLSRRMASAFAEQYRHHLWQEEEEIYPFANQLPADCLAALGQRMQARRGG